MTKLTQAPAQNAQPDLLYSEAEDDLRSAVRSLLTGRGDTGSTLTRAETGAPYDSGLWKALAADMGAAGLLVPEKLGGQGASHREAAVVLEELGRSVTPAPYLTSSVIATETLLALDTESEEVAGLLAELASGRKVAVLAVPLSASPHGPLAVDAPRRHRCRRRGDRRCAAGAAGPTGCTRSTRRPSPSRHRPRST